MLDTQTQNSISRSKYKDDPMCKNISDYILHNNLTDLEFTNRLNKIIKQEGDSAEKTVKRSTVTNWKNGVQRPSEKRWKYIAKLLGISIAEFKEEKGYEKSLKLKKDLEETKIRANNLKIENAKLKRKVADKEIKDSKLNYTNDIIKFYEQSLTKKMKKNILIPKEEILADNKEIQETIKKIDNLYNNYQTDDK